MFVVLNTGFTYCIWNRADYLIGPAECLLILMKTGKSVGQRRYDNACVKMAFILYNYNRTLETSCHFRVSSTFKQRLSDIFTRE